MSKLVCGVGKFYEGKYKGWENGRATLEYSTWNSMLTRAYSKREHSRNKTYCNCSADERFHSFQWFSEWANSQIGFGNSGYDLDKDILIKGNKVYSPEICVFVPRKINTFLLKCTASRGQHPIGVYYHKKSGSFISRVWSDGRRKYIGSYKNVEEAFVAYKTEKEDEAKVIAKEFSGSVDHRVIEALMKYKVEITD